MAISSFLRVFQTSVRPANWKLFISSFSVLGLAVHHTLHETSPVSYTHLNASEIDAVTSATKNKTRAGNLAAGSYHVNADGTDITGVSFPVKVLTQMCIRDR